MSTLHKGKSFSEKLMNLPTTANLYRSLNGLSVYIFSSDLNLIKLFRCQTVSPLGSVGLPWLLFSDVATVFSFTSRSSSAVCQTLVLASLKVNFHPEITRCHVRRHWTAPKVCSSTTILLYFCLMPLRISWIPNPVKYGKLSTRIESQVKLEISCDGESASS